MESIKITVRSFLEEKKKAAGLTDTDDLFAKGFVDSLFALQLVMFLEKEFQIKISNRDIVEDNFRTVNNIAETVARIRDKK